MGDVYLSCGHRAGPDDNDGRGWAVAYLDDDIDLDLDAVTPCVVRAVYCAACRAELVADGRALCEPVEVDNG